MWNAVKSLFRSRKFLLFFATLITLVGNKYLEFFHWSTEEVFAGLLFVGMLIGAIAYEDGKEKGNVSNQKPDVKEAA